MAIVKNITLYCTEGSSDKEYQASIEETNGGFLVNFAYGRRGSALKTGTKTNAPVSFEKAQKVYDSLVKSKTAKGYTEAESGARYVGTDLEERDSGLSPMLPSPIERDELEALINDDDWAFSEKMDGENRIIIVDAEGIRGVNRRGLLCSLRQEWTGEFMIPGDERMVFAGEDMGDHFAVFDLIESEMTDEASDLVVRHKAATYLVGTSDWTRIVPLAVGSEEKRKLLAKVEAEGGEGIVAKRIRTAYTGGRHRSPCGGRRHRGSGQCHHSCQPRCSCRRRSRRGRIHDAIRRRGPHAAEVQGRTDRHRWKAFYGPDYPHQAQEGGLTRQDEQTRQKSQGERKKWRNHSSSSEDTR